MNGTQRIGLIARLEDAIEWYNVAVYNCNQYNTVNTQIAYEKANAVLTEVRQIADLFLDLVLVFDDGDYMYRPVQQFIIDDVHYYVWKENVKMKYFWKYYKTKTPKNKMGYYVMSSDDECICEVLLTVTQAKVYNDLLNKNSDTYIYRIRQRTEAD